MNTVNILGKGLKVILIGILVLQVGIFLMPASLTAEELDPFIINEEINYLISELNINSLWPWQYIVDMNTRLPKILFGSLTYESEGRTEEIAQNFISEYSGLVNMQDCLNTCEMVETINSTGTFVLFIQKYDNIPVEKSYILVSITPDNRVSMMKAKLFRLKDVDTNPILSETEAYNLAVDDAKKDLDVIEPGDIFLSLSPDARLIWNVCFKTDEFGGTVKYAIENNGFIFDRKIEMANQPEELMNRALELEDVKNVLNSITNPGTRKASIDLINVLSRLSEDDYKEIVTEAVITADINVTGGQNLQKTVELLKNNLFISAEMYSNLAAALENKNISIPIGQIDYGPAEDTLPAETPADCPPLPQQNESVTGNNTSDNTDTTANEGQKPVISELAPAFDKPEPMPIYELPEPETPVNQPADTNIQEAIAEQIYTEPVLDTAGPKPPFYTIQPGDTLENIALYFNVSVESIVSMNPVGAYGAGQLLDMRQPSANMVPDTLENALNDLHRSEIMISEAETQFIDIQNSLNNAIHGNDSTTIQILETHLALQQIEISAAQCTYLDLRRHVDAIAGQMANDTNTTTQYSDTYNVSEAADSSSSIAGNSGTNGCLATGTLTGSNTNSDPNLIAMAETDDSTSGSGSGGTATGSISGYNYDPNYLHIAMAETDDSTSGSGNSGTATGSISGYNYDPNSLCIAMAETDYGLSGGCGTSGGSGSGSGSSTISTNTVDMYSNIIKSAPDMQMETIQDLSSAPTLVTGGCIATGNISD